MLQLVPFFTRLYNSQNLRTQMLPSDSDLQHQIREKELELLRLYEKRHVISNNYQMLPATTSSLVYNTYYPALTGKSLKHTPQLRIRDGPPAAPPGETGTPESVAFPLTSEKRHFTSKGLLETEGTMPALTKTAVSTISGTPAVPPEFAERLWRLSKTASAQVTPWLPTPHFSLMCSPIPPVSGDEDTSYSGLSEINVDLFCEKDGDLRREVDKADNSVHVRFSSCNPPVSAFSVERCCPRAAPAQAALVHCETSLPFVNSPLSSLVRCRVGDNTEMRSKREGVSPLTANSAASSANAEPTLLTTFRKSESSPLVSRISTVLSPRSSAASYLTLIDELRSSLLNTTVRKSRGTPLGVCKSAPFISGDSSRVVRAPKAEGEETDAATPMKYEEIHGRVPSRSSVLACDAAAQHTPLVITPKDDIRAEELCPKNVRKSADYDAAELLDTMMNTSPIFLQRSDRREMYSETTRDASVLTTQQGSAFCENVPPQCIDTKHFRVKSLPSSVARSMPERGPQQPSPATKDAPGPTTTKRKKSVHFCASLEQVGGEITVAVGNRKRSRGAAHTPPSTCVPAKMPPNMCVEQKGFGAGILLASGPTLYFE